MIARPRLVLVLVGVSLSCARVDRVDPGQTVPGGDAAVAGDGRGTGGAAAGGGTGGTAAGGSGGAAPTAMPSRPLGPWGGSSIDPQAPATAPAMFGGREITTGGPTIVYPLDGSMHPINVLDVTVQWRGVNATGGLYRLRFQNARGTMDVFTTCTVTECLYPMPGAVWHKIAEPNPDSDVVLTISAAGAEVRSSAPLTLHFSPTDVAGALYYWSTSNKGLLRLSLGQRKALPFNPAGGAGSTGTCVGCHSVSRNGKRIAWSSDTMIGVAPIDAPAQTRNTTMTGMTAPALNAEGTRFLVPIESGLTLYNAETAQPISTVSAAFLQKRKALFPEWSPDGKEIALTLSKVDNGRPVGAEGVAGDSLLGLATGDVVVLPYNNGAFGPVRVLVASATENSYYPSWSPDGRWIVFSVAPDDNTYNNSKARLRLVASTGGTVYDLGRATHTPNTTSSWPKFAPFSQAAGQVMFIGFSSTMEYGFRLRSGTQSQLWFAAIDLRRLGQGDPSWAPIWLPFQEVDQSNHLPYWTEVLGCTNDADCGGLGRCERINVDIPECRFPPVIE